MFKVQVSALCIAALLLEATATAMQPAAPRLIVRPDVERGERPSIRITGLEPEEVIRIHNFQQLMIWEPDGSGDAASNWRPRPTLMHGWGDYRADRQGRVDLATARPLAGTSRQIGPETLIWSAHRANDPRLAAVAVAARGLPKLPAGTVVVRAERQGEIVAESQFRIGAEPAGATIVEISTPELTGVFAAPAGAKGLPTLIHLHGSEGGSFAKARADALHYAGRGFATLAIAYFAWPYERGSLTIPAAHQNIDVGQLDRARRWLAGRSEADTERIGLIGNSKGAEFALVGSVTYPWVRAVVACVPSDIVWEGYGAVDWTAPGASVPTAGTYSSWSIDGQPLPYLPTFGDRREGWPDNRARYDEARAHWPEAARWARIPVEQTRARLFLIGGGRDRVWASGSMTTAIVATMRRAGRGNQIKALISPESGHSLCGNGQWPYRSYEDDRNEAEFPDLDKQGAAEVAAHQAKLAFLAAALAR